MKTVDQAYEEIHHQKMVHIHSVRNVAKPAEQTDCTGLDNRVFSPNLIENDEREEHRQKKPFENKKITLKNLVFQKAHRKSDCINQYCSYPAKIRQTIEPHSAADQRKANETTCQQILTDTEGVVIEDIVTSQKVKPEIQGSNTE